MSAGPRPPRWARWEVVCQLTPDYGRVPGPVPIHCEWTATRWGAHRAARSFQRLPHVVASVRYFARRVTR